MSNLNNLKRNLQRKNQFNQAKKESGTTNYVEALTKQWQKEKTRDGVRQHDKPIPDYTNWTDSNFL